MHKRRSYFAVLFISLFGAGLTAGVPVVGPVLMAISVFGLAYVIWPRQVRNFILRRTPIFRPFLTRVMDSLIPQPRPVLISRGVERAEDDGVFQIRFVIQNKAGGATARNLSVTFELPPDIGGDSRGSGRIEERVQDAFELKGRVGVASGMYNERKGLAAGVYSDDFFGPSIPEESYPSGSKISLKYRMDAEGMEPVFGHLDVTVDLDSWRQNSQP